MILTGYHGTHKSSVNEILTNEFTSNIRNDHWLGQGIYFFDDLELAKWWAEKKFNSSSAAVISATINTEPDKILNLDTRIGLNTFIKELKRILSDITVSIKFKAFDYSDRMKNFCLAIDLVKRCLNLDVIIMTFSKKDPTYGEFNLWDFEKDYFLLLPSIAYKETQICVKDNSVISTKICCFSASNERKRTW